MTEDDLDRSLLLARQGVALDDSLQTRGNLLAALLKSPAAIGVVRGDGDALIDLDLSPDGRTLAYMENDGTLRFVDARTRRPAAPAGRPAGLRRLRHRLDRRASTSCATAPTGRGSRSAAARRSILDAATHRVLAHLQIGSDRFGRLVSGLRFSPDGRTLYAAARFLPTAASLVLRFDGRTGRRLGGAVRDRPRRLREHHAHARRPRARDGRLRRARETVIRDARTLRALRRVPVSDQYTALSPDGRTLLLGGADGSVRFADLQTGKVRVASGSTTAWSSAASSPPTVASPSPPPPMAASSSGTSATLRRARSSPATTAGSPRWRSAATARRSTAARWTVRS